MEIKIKGNNNVTFGTLLVGELFVEWKEVEAVVTFETVFIES